MGLGSRVLVSSVLENLFGLFWGLRVVLVGVFGGG